RRRVLVILRTSRSPTSDETALASPASTLVELTRSAILPGIWRPRMRQNGTVKFFNQSKGFGFITPDQGGKDVFVHITAVERSGIGPLDEGMRVSFETEPDKRGKGPKAVNLQVAQ